MDFERSFFTDINKKNDWLMQSGNIQLWWIKNKQKVKHKKKGGKFCEKG